MDRHHPQPPNINTIMATRNLLNWKIFLNEMIAKSITNNLPFWKSTIKNIHLAKLIKLFSWSTQFCFETFRKLIFHWKKLNQMKENELINICKNQLQNMHIPIYIQKVREKNEITSMDENIDMYCICICMHAIDLRRNSKAKRVIELIFKLFEFVVFAQVLHKHLIANFPLKHRCHSGFSISNRIQIQFHPIQSNWIVWMPFDGLFECFKWSKYNGCQNKYVV